MTIESRLVTAVLANPTLSTAIGTRIYPKVLPPNATLPAIVYNQVGNNRRYTTNGLSLWSGQLAIFSTDYTQTKTLRSALETVLAGPDVGASELNFRDDYEPETKLYSELADVVIAYED